MSAAIVAGIDLGGTKCVIGWVDDRGVILERFRFPSPRTPAELVAEVGRALSHHAVSAVGVGVPGFVSRDRTRVIRCPNLPAYIDYELARELSDVTGVEVRLENDANAAALGEARFGAGRGYSDQLFVILGTGVGGGIIANGQLVRGAGYAGEVGHITIDPTAEQCGCGRLGCWELYASGGALARIAGVERGEDVSCAIAEGAPWAIAALSEYGDQVAAGLADLLLITAAEVVVLGGGVSDLGDPLVSAIRPHLKAYMPDFVELPVLTTATLGNDAGIIGAALGAM